jgi:polyisoprenoid-binding protein YceI
VHTTKPSPFRRAALAIGAALVIGSSTLGFAAYSYLKPTATASTPISAVPLTAATTNTTTTSELSTTGGATLYTIQASDSTASFVIDEVLRGSPYTVIGTTDQVAGQLALDPSDPSTAQLGTILINARTLTTDDDSRNRALGNRILSTDQYEYISFTPTTLSGLPTSITTTQPFSFEVSGDLTIKDVTRQATFDVTVTPDTDGSLDGQATTTINYADWGLSIPSVPFVASVEDEVALHLDFSATATA